MKGSFEKCGITNQLLDKFVFILASNIYFCCIKCGKSER
jgi:hypothetical protein